MQNNTTGIKTVPATEMQRISGQLLDAVLRGETLVLTRHRRPVAVLRPLTDEELVTYGRAA